MIAVIYVPDKVTSWLLVACDGIVLFMVLPEGEIDRTVCQDVSKNVI